MEVALYIAAVALVMALYVNRYWRYFKFLRWTLRAIDDDEQQDRQRKRLCVTCGYDLRASKMRCPECGTPVPADRTYRDIR